MKTVMHQSTRVLFVSTLIFVVLISRLPPKVKGCATLSRGNVKGSDVGIATESTVIIWDSTKKIQHFIRRASFTTNAKDFGFLVPTPSKPTLKEVGNAIFTRFEKLTAPKVLKKIETRYKFNPFSYFSLMMSSQGLNRATPGGYVRILDEGRIGNLDFTILAANDAMALNEWLRKHGYISRPALTRWLDFYVKKKWMITAFKIAKEKAERYYVRTSAVRMTFKTEKPFFPYREPEDQKKTKLSRRLLRIFFLSDKRVQGKIGDGGIWPGKVEYARPLSSEEQAFVADRLDMPTFKNQHLWLTAMDDKSRIRPGDEDVYFSASANQDQKVRPPIVWTDYDTVNLGWICWSLVILVPMLVLIVNSIHKRRARKKLVTDPEGPPAHPPLPPSP